MRAKLLPASLFCSIALIAGAACAHETHKGPNGGVVADAGGGTHVELVTNGGVEVIVFLSDAQNKPMSAAGYKAKALLIIGGKAERFTLEAAEGAIGRMAGKAPAPTPAGVKGVIQLVAPDGSSAQAKF